VETNSKRLNQGKGTKREIPGREDPRNWRFDELCESPITLYPQRLVRLARVGLPRVHDAHKPQLV